MCKYAMQGAKVHNIAQRRSVNPKDSLNYPQTDKPSALTQRENSATPVLAGSHPLQDSNLPYRNKAPTVEETTLSGRRVLISLPLGSIQQVGSVSGAC